MLKDSQQYLCCVQKFFLFPHFNMNPSNRWFHSEHIPGQDKIPGRKIIHTFTFGSAAQHQASNSLQLKAAKTPLNHSIPWSYLFPGNLSVRAQGLLRLFWKLPFVSVTMLQRKAAFRGENWFHTSKETTCCPLNTATHRSTSPSPRTGCRY